MIDMNKKYRYRNGEPARILCVDRNNTKQPVVSMGTYGVIRVHNIQEEYFILSTDSDYDLIEETPYADFKTDDKVLVRNYENYVWEKRYFSHEKDGFVYCFRYGQTSWSNALEPDVWTSCKKWEET